MLHKDSYCNSSDCNRCYATFSLWVSDICCKERPFNYVNEFILRLCAVHVMSCTFQIHYIILNLLYLFSSSWIFAVGWWCREAECVCFSTETSTKGHFCTFSLSSDGLLFMLIFTELVYILEPQQSCVQNVFWAD